MNIERQRAAFEEAIGRGKTYTERDFEMFRLGLDRQGRGEPVVGERFMRAWVNLDKLPGTMMVGPEGIFGPIAASTSCWITTSEREAEYLKAKGPVLEVWATPQPADPAMDVDEWVKSILAEFPLLDDEGLDENEHHCEWALQQDRKRLHALLKRVQPASGDDAVSLAERVKALESFIRDVVAGTYGSRDRCRIGAALLEKS